MKVIINNKPSKDALENFAKTLDEIVSKELSNKELNKELNKETDKELSNDTL